MVKWSNISTISAYKRADAHLTKRTTHGAVVTILGVILGITLACHEISWYLGGKGTSKMAVDLARRHDLNIHVDISFLAIPCAGLSVDVMDASGTAGSDANHAKGVHLHKMRLDARGRRVGGKDGEYHTPQSQQMVQDKSGTVMQIDLGAAMTQMSDMDAEIQQHEGCRVYGDISVRRVAGRLHFAVHQQSFIDVLPQMLTGHVLPKLTNMSHVINKVAFGPEYPGQVNPLDGFTRITAANDVPHAYKYFLKIVPTEYYTRMGVVLETSQYSVGEYAMPLNNGPAPRPVETDKDGNVHKLAQGTGAEPTGGGAAGASDSHATSTVQNTFVDFSYDLSPIVMTINQSPASLLHFIVRLCAVVGGVLSVTRMMDKIVHALLVGSGIVVLERSSTGGKGRGSSYGGYSSGFSSARSSLPGDATAYVSPGSPISRGSFGSGSYGGYVSRASSGGGGLLPDGNMHQRTAGSFPGNAPVPSHPISRFNSGASSYAGGPGSGSGSGAQNGVPLATANSTPHSFPGGPPTSFGGMNSNASSMGGSANGSAVVGDAIAQAGSTGGVGSPVTSTGGAVVITPTASGQVTPLLGSASGGVVHRGSGGGFSSGGGAAPGSYTQQHGISRLASGAGPGQQFGR